MIAELVCEYEQRDLPIVEVCLSVVYLVVNLSQFLERLCLEKRLKLLIH